jgi:outer membrane lipoprotein SlyB
MTSKSSIAIVSAILFAITGCSSTALNQGGNPDSYARGQTMVPGRVMEGTVLQIRQVSISGTKMASTIGAAIGGLAGAALTKGKANNFGMLLTGAVGAAAGGIVGTFASESKGTEIVVKLSDNNVRVFVQEKTGTAPVAGDKVLVLINGTEARIVSKQ